MSANRVILLACGAVITEGGVLLAPSFGVQLSYPSASRQVVFIPAATNYRVQEEVHQNYSPYSIGYRDYLYLQQQKNYENKFNPEPTYEVVHHHHQNIYHQPSNVVPQNNDGISLLSTNAQKNSDGPKWKAGNNLINGYSGPAIIVPDEPIVSKHIYFHAPPPEEEAPVLRVAPPPPQKKKYNIIFIKAPSQEADYGRVQELLQSAPLEDKTLIYVLSGSAEPQPPVLQAPRPVSAPEVFYIKYKVNHSDVQINNQFDESSLFAKHPTEFRARLDLDKNNS